MMKVAVTKTREKEIDEQEESVWTRENERKRKCVREKERVRLVGDAQHAQQPAQ